MNKVQAEFSFRNRLSRGTCLSSFIKVWEFKHADQHHEHQATLTIENTSSQSKRISFEIPKTGKGDTVEDSDVDFI